MEVSGQLDALATLLQGNEPKLVKSFGEGNSPLPCRLTRTVLANKIL